MSECLCLLHVMCVCGFFLFVYVFMCIYMCLCECVCVCLSVCAFKAVYVPVSVWQVCVAWFYSCKDTCVIV